MSMAVVVLIMIWVALFTVLFVWAFWGDPE